MVVCNSPMMPITHAAYPVPASMHHFPPGMCPVSAITCHQRYPPPTILTNGQMLTTAPTTMSCAPAISTPPVIRCNQPPYPQTTTPNSTDSSDSSNLSCNTISSNCNTILTYAPLPTNFVPITNNLTTILPYNQTNLIQIPSKAPTTSSASSVVQCNQGLYTCSQMVPTNAIVPCQQRIVNGQSVLHCTPGVCQITQAAMYPNGTVEMCPIPSTQILQNNAAIYPVNPTMSITQNICTAASNWKQSYGMEQVWQHEFRNLFLNYTPHSWFLQPVFEKPKGVWHANVDSAKVRFCCEDCGHGWTSMKGRVAFWFAQNPVTKHGVVCLRLYGQQCDRCKTGNYEAAMWYPEEVTKVLVNIYNRVGQVFYGFREAPYHKARRPGKPRTPHNSELCQACMDGVCAERR